MFGRIAPRQSIRGVQYGTLNFLATFATNSIRARLAYALLFLFPVAGFLVRHWTSTIFVLLALLLGCIRRHWSLNRLANQERVLLGILAIYFLGFVASAAANGAWPEFVSRLGVELRFLFFIPLYLLVRELDHAYDWLVRGCGLAAVVGLGQAVYEGYWLGQPVVAGVYHNQIPVGTIHALYAGLLFDRFWTANPRKAADWAIGFSALAAVGVTLAAGSRGGYLVLLGVMLSWGIVRLPVKRLVVFSLLLVVVGLAILGTSDRVRARVDDALNAVISYASMESPAQFEGPLTSQGQRFEMWKAAWWMFLDHPILGVGRHRYNVVAQEYVVQGRVHRDAASHGHPHNAYLANLAEKGAVGLVIFLVLLLYPLKRFLIAARSERGRGVEGVMLISAFVIASLTESSPFYQGSFASQFLVFLAVCFASVYRTSEPRISFKSG